MASLFKKINFKNIKHKDEFILVSVTLLLFVFVIAIVFWNITFLATSLSKATDETTGAGTQQIRFNLDAAQGLGLE